MTLSPEQLATIVTSALPGEQLKDHRAQQGGRITVELVSLERLDLYIFGSAQEAATAVAALRKLRGEVDLPLPMLRASDVQGELIGTPYLLASALAGEPLAQALPHIGEEHLNTIGEQLGQCAYRVHRLSCDHYGSLAETDGPADERSYTLARLDQGLALARSHGIVSPDEADELRSWFDEFFLPAGTVAALSCGGLSANTILVRRNRDRWALSGILGWEQAIGWAPAWDHTLLLEATRGSAYFALRVGYGNAYDDQTQRTYEQVREGVLRAYRMIHALEQAIAAQVHGDLAERERNRRLLAAILSFGG
jgi:hypothetical protein